MFLLDRRRKSRAVIFAIVLTVVFYLYLQGQRLPFPVPRRFRTCAAEYRCSDFDVPSVQFRRESSRQVRSRQDIPADESTENEDYDTVEFHGSRNDVDSQWKGQLVDPDPKPQRSTQIGVNLLGDVAAKQSTITKIDFGLEGDVIAKGSGLENGVSTVSIPKRNKMKYSKNGVIIPKEETASIGGAVSAESKTRKAVNIGLDESVLKAPRSKVKKTVIDVADTTRLKNTDAKSRDAVRAEIRPASASEESTGERPIRKGRNSPDISRSSGTSMSAKLEASRKSRPLDSENAASMAPGIETKIMTGSGVSASGGVKPMFRFLIDVTDVCDDHVTILIIVCSAADNRRRRDLIRRTWASVRDEQLRVLFLIGRPENRPKPSTNNPEGSGSSRIRQESLEHGDLLQADFLDVYANLSLKSVAMLQWTAARCSSVAAAAAAAGRRLRFLVKADDDVLVNTPLLLHDLRSTRHRRFVMGSVVAGARPVRDPASKWFTPVDVYAGSFYPKYVSGAAYVISADLIGELYAAAADREAGRQIFWIEDVFVTGILMTAANGRGLTDVQHIYNGKFDIDKEISDACALKRHLVRHLRDPNSIVDLWSKITSKSASCFI